LHGAWGAPRDLERYPIREPHLPLRGSPSWGLDGSVCGITDCEQPPATGNALELVLAAVREAKPGADDQIRDCP
jgi:hypothetical protein